MRTGDSRNWHSLVILASALVLTFCTTVVGHAQVQPIHVFDSPNHATISGVALSPDGTKVVAGSIDARVWDVRTGELIATLQRVERFGYDGDNAVTAVSFSSDGNRVVTGDWYAAVRIWDVQTAELIQTFQVPRSEYAHGSWGFVYAVALSADGRYLLANCEHEVLLWDVQSGDEILRLAGSPPIEEKYLAFFPDGKRFLLRRSLNENAGAEVWDIPTWSVVRTFDGYSGILSADGKRVLTLLGRHADTYALWNAETGELIRSFGERALSTRLGALSPNGSIVVVRLKDGASNITDTQTTAVLRELSLSGKHLSPHQAFSADGRLTVTADRDSVYVWDISDLTSAVGDAALYNR